MITLRGKVTRSLVEAKPVTPAITRSTLDVGSQTFANDAESSPAAAPPPAAVQTDASAQNEQQKPRPMVEEWLWRGVWAFGSLPEEDVDVLAGITDGEGEEKGDASTDVEASKADQAKEAPSQNDEEKTDEQKDRGDVLPSTSKPRPFFYRFIKPVNATDVIVPSSLLVVEEEVAEAKDEQVEMKSEVDKQKDEAGTGASGDNAKNETVDQSIEGAAVSETSQTLTSQADVAAKPQVSADDQTQPQSTTQTDTTKPTGDGAVPKPDPAQSKQAEQSTTSTTPPTQTTPTPTTTTTLLQPKQTYGDPPYKPASILHPTTSPPGGKWEGHFENIVPNNTLSASKKRKDKKDNRIREVFYLFFNSTPDKDAKTAFVADDGAAVANEQLSTVEDGEKVDPKGDEKALLLPEGRIHVRGYGTNRFGTFEIVGSLDLDGGMLHCQRMYVETPPEKETKRPKREGTGRRGRPPKNKDGEGGKRGRKRKPSLKKRTMDPSFVDETDGDNGGMDIASSVKKRARLSVDSTGSDGGTPLLPQQEGKPTSLKLAPKSSSGGKGKKKKAVQNKEVTISQFVQPLVDVMEPLPSDGDPLLARWRAAHYLYYQREEVNPEDGEGVTASKVSSVVYEGEMVDGYREGMGICLYDNDTMYEGQWKKNKEHGKGTLMTSDRSKIIYQGDWERGRMHGSGSYFYHKDLYFGGGGEYVGDFRENLRHGRGIYTFPDGSTYEGQWKENTPNGWGLFKWPDGSLYEGFWAKGRRHGNSGTLIVSDGFRYEGAWVDNAMEGRGIATYPNGQVYEGMWVAGRREGRGTIRFTNGAVYEGRFKDDNMEGQGTMKMCNNAIIPPHSDDEDSDDETLQRDGEPKNDWMIPIEFQSDISHIHQKAGFTQVGL